MWVGLPGWQALGALGSHLTGSRPGSRGRNPRRPRSLPASYNTQTLNSSTARAQKAPRPGPRLCLHPTEGLNNVIFESVLWK